MKTKLRILLLEDHPIDAELLAMILDAEGFQPAIQQVETRADYEKALKGGEFDVIIADFSLPSYDGLSALALAKVVRPLTPFIFYTGSLGEEAAVEALKSGASDYVLKQRPQRLGTAIQRALNEARQREEHRRAEAQISTLIQLLDLASDAVTMRDTSDALLFWNKGAERLYGFTREEALARRITDLVYSKDLTAFAEAKETTLRSGEWSGELTQKGKDGRSILVASRWTLMRSEDGKPMRMLVINSDITEKRNLEAQFLRAQRLESIGTLASGVAHDLNNILAPILIGTELLRATKLENDAREMVETIGKSAERGAAIVKQITTFVRGSEGKRIVLRLKHLMQDVCNLVRKTFPKNIEVFCTLPPNLRAVLGDPTQLHQVLMNLCINARDAMPDGGKLTLRAVNADVDGAQQVRITVEDTGTGMPPEVVEKAFDPFFTTKEPGKGTGLGLATVLGIVRSHAGSIKIHSQPGQGTCFEILLPAEEAPAAPQSMKDEDPAPSGRGELILVVDDEAEIRRLVGQTLSQHGYDIVTAADGNQGIIQFLQKKEDIRLVIADLLMPEVDGAALARAIRSINPRVRLIVTSGQMETSSIPEADAFLKKPFSTEGLLQAVTECLSGSNSGVPAYS